MKEKKGSLLTMRQDCLWQIIRSLDNWVERNGWAGWDPYSIRELPFMAWISNQGRKHRNSLWFRVLNKAVTVLVERFSPFLIKLFDCPKRINAKGMGLFGLAYFILYRKSGDKRYKKRALEALEWLEQNRSKGYDNYCWGYPFDWHSSYLIPRGTPSVVVTKTCGDAFWKAYRMTSEKKYLEICKSICRFITDDLRLLEGSDADEICISYTPIADVYVHNASLMGAEFLAKVGLEIGETDWLQLARRAANYTIRQQRSNGAFSYYGCEEPRLRLLRPNVMDNFDNYHTGFVVRSLFALAKILSDDVIWKSAYLAGRFYVDSFIDADGCPKILPDRRYPVNIHACAESILCLKVLQECMPDLARKVNDLLPLTIEWILKNMWVSRKGFFGHLKTRTGLVKVPFVRWNQAWMMYALAEAL